MIRATSTGEQIQRPARMDPNFPVPVPDSLSHEADRDPDVPSVSIYMPAYNAVDTIVPAIRSALEQTVDDIELCVVDDGSTDGTADLITETFSDDKRVRLERQVNSGIGAASNRAVRMCRAPFIGQLDADDQLLPNAVGRMWGVLRSNPSIGVAYSSSELIDEDGTRIGNSYEYPRYSRFDLMYLMIVHHFRMFRARDWYRTSGFATDITNAVDYDMYLKLAEVTDMVHIPEQLYQYRKLKTSTSQAEHATQRANHRLAVQRALDRRGLGGHWKLAPDQPLDPRAYEFVERDGEPGHFGRDLDLVRLSLFTGWNRDAMVGALQQMFPAWTIEKRRRLGEPRIESPPLSHARAIRLIDCIAEQFPHCTIRLVYA